MKAYSEPSYLRLNDQMIWSMESSQERNSIYGSFQCGTVGQCSCYWVPVNSIGELSESTVIKFLHRPRYPLSCHCLNQLFTDHIILKITRRFIFIENKWPSCNFNRDNSN